MLVTPLLFTFLYLLNTDCRNIGCKEDLNFLTVGICYKLIKIILREHSSYIFRKWYIINYKQIAGSAALKTFRGEH